MLFATSCQNDLDLGLETGDNAVVSFNVTTPDMVTRAYSDGTTATHLQYAVYDANGIILPNLTKTDATINGSTTVELQLTTGNTYSVIFWAAAPNAPYTVDLGAKTMTVDYAVDKTLSNDEKRDAFYKYYTFTVTGAQTETIELRRPFAQINIGTADYTASTSAGYTPTQSAVTVKNAYRTLDLVEGKVSDEVEVTYATANIKKDETFPVTGYEYLAMNYVLVGAEKGVVDVEFTYTDGSNAKTRTVGSVPVQRNYRTNIYGNLLTSMVDINVEIVPEYEDDNKYGVEDGKVYIKVNTVEEFNEAFADENIDMIILGEDINITSSVTRAADPTLTVSKGKTLEIDLNGKKLSATSTATGKNYNMFDVNGGTLTVKNGTMEYKHEGENMGWSNSTNLFNVTAGGVLNLNGVTAKNLGGSDMAFVAHLNNWGEVTLNVENSTLESTYIAVRAFNSGNDMNNVTIKNSTLSGKYCFWVHNYTVADFGTQEKADAHKALLNFDIFNGTNTFTYTGKAPVRYGFTDAIYFDENGSQLIYDAATLASALTANEENINVALANDIELPINTLGTMTGGSGEYKLGGENTKNLTINLNNQKLTITTTYWSVLGAKNADAIFTIKNGTMTSSQPTGTWNSYDLCFANCNYNLEDVVFEKAIALEADNKVYNLNNVTINETHDYYAMWVSAVGQTLNIDGLTIDSKGRGIKIDEQYVGNPAKVTMNINNATFTTANKAAILVKSVAGAEINVSNIDITNVAKDSDFAVWVDEDAAAYADKVVVNGAMMKVEGSSTILASTPAELANATIENNSTIYLGEGSFIVPNSAQGKTVTFIGTGNPENTIIATMDNGSYEGCNYALDGSTVLFENISINTTSKNYIGYARCNGTYKNCIINGTYTLYGNSVFENCTFNVSGNVYNIWTWGAPKATFTKCTFNSDGKAMLLYGQANTQLTIENCVFNDKGGLTELKAAIEIGNDYNTSYELIVNNTVVNGYEINDKGINTGTTLWANKNSMPQDKLNVVVDGVDVY